MDWLAAQPRPRGRRAALDRPARRVGPRRLAQVRPGLGLAGQRPHRLPAAWSAATGASASTPRRIRERRRPGPLRGPRQHDVVALAAGAGPALGDPGPGRAPLGRAPRPLPRRGPARRGAAARSSPGRRSPPLPCPTCPRRSAGAWSRSTCSTPREFLTPVAPPSVAASRAQLRARRRPRADPPLLARADLGQLGLDGLDRAAPARLRGGGARGSPRA